MTTDDKKVPSWLINGISDVNKRLSHKFIVDEYELFAYREYIHFKCKTCNYIISTVISYEHTTAPELIISNSIEKLQSINISCEEYLIRNILE